MLFHNEEGGERCLASISINHVGFMLNGLSTGELGGINGMLFYIVVYMITTVSIFFLCLVFRIFEYSYHYQIRYTKDLGFSSETNPVLALKFIFNFALYGCYLSVGLIFLLNFLF